MPSIPKLIESALKEPSIRSTIVLLLDHASEIKHEDTICSLISAHLRKRQEVSERKVLQSKRSGAKKTRCVDIVIYGKQIEAKYHFEGDLARIDRNLKNGRFKFNSRKKGSPTATRDVCSEILRPPPAYFLWMVCVRSDVAKKPNDKPPYYKLDDLNKAFYKWYGDRGLGGYKAAIKLAESEIDTTIWKHFRKFATGRGRKIRLAKALPTIRGEHSGLIIRLYSLSKGSQKSSRRQ